MKKLLYLGIVLIVMLSLTGCVILVVDEDETEAVETVAPAPVEEKPVADEPVVEEKAEESAKGYLEFDPIKGLVPGVLYQLNLEEGKEPVVKGVALAGNQAGSSINEKEPSVEGLRFVFNRQEWITIKVDSPLSADEFSSYFEEGLWAFVVPHEDNPASLDAAWFEGAMDIPVPYSPLELTDDGITWDTYVWNTFEPGFFDLIFTYKAKPVAMVLIRIYAEDILTELPDEQLQAFMNEATEEAKQL